MKEKEEQQNTTHKTTNPDTNATEAQEQQVGYPDISKANTKMIVIVSFIVIVIIFFLSVMFPQPIANDGTTEQSTGTEVTTEVSDTETNSSK